MSSNRIEASQAKGSDERRRVMTVLHTTLLMGGAETVAVDLALSLDSDRFQASICALKASAAPTRADEIAASGLAYTSLDAHSMRDPKGFAAFVRLLRSERIDILHAHLWDANLWAALAAPLARIPVLITHEHTWAYEGERFRVATDRHVIARIASAMACVSEEDRRKMIEVEKIPPERIRVIPNGIAPLPSRLGTDIRAEFGIDPAARVVGVVAVARRQKRLDVLLEAIALLAIDLPDVQLAFAGNGSAALMAEIESLAVSKGIRDRVHLLGRRNDIADVLAAFDVACLSSDFEGQPLAVMEYMAAGKAIVCTNVGGLSEMIEHNVEGLLVPRRNPAALADSIKRLLLDRALAESMGLAARRRQERDFSLAATVARVEALYDELWEQTASHRKATTPTTSSSV